MKKARLIYNPTSGKEQVKKNLPYILARLEEAGYETSTHATRGVGDAKLAAEQAVSRGFDLVVAAGGDGTINEVINGLAEKPNRPKLGIIPVGTTNDFARAVGIPRSIVKACNILASGRETPIDIGKMNDRYFINIAGGGKLTELTYEVPSKLKTALGQLAYYLKGIEMLPSLKPTYAKIEYDDGVFEGEISLFLVSNSNSVGGFEKIAPDADLSDGKFDLLIVKKTNLAELIRLTTAAVTGNHLKDGSIVYKKARRIRITTDQVVQLNLDGEYGGVLPATFENLQQHITLIAPK